MSLTDAYNKMIDGLNHCLMNPQSMNRALVRGFKELSNASGDVGGKVEYSTTEREVGTWTDGSKLYQIDISYTCENSTQTQTAHTFPIGAHVRKVIAPIFENTVGDMIETTWINTTFWDYVIDNQSTSPRVLVKRETSYSEWQSDVVFTATIQYTKS